MLIAGLMYISRDSAVSPASLLSPKRTLALIFFGKLGPAIGTADGFRRQSEQRHGLSDEQSKITAASWAANEANLDEHSANEGHEKYQRQPKSVRGSTNE